MHTPESPAQSSDHEQVEGGGALIDDEVSKGKFTLLEHCHNVPWSIVSTQGKMADFVYIAVTTLHGAL